MAFNNRINTEVFYYRNALMFMKKSLLEYRVLEMEDKNRSKRIEARIPTSSQSINNGILAVINFACCAEACYNIALREYYQTREIGNSEQEQELKAAEERDLRLCIPEKINLINELYSDSLSSSLVISKKLIKRLVYMASVRNKLVHYSMPAHFSGEVVLDGLLEFLQEKNILSMYETVNTLIDQFICKGILHNEIRSEDAIVIGEGDFDDEALPRWRQFLFVVKHPFWYMFKRIPNKIKYLAKKREFDRTYHLLPPQR